MFFKSLIRVNLIGTRWVLKPVVVRVNYISLGTQPLKKTNTVSVTNDVKLYSPCNYNLKLAYFREYMLKNIDKYPSIYFPGDNSLSESFSTAKLFKDFETNNENDKYSINELRNAVIARKNEISPDELLEIVYLFASKCFTCSKNQIFPLVQALNEELFRLYKTQSTNDRLRFLDALFPSPFFKSFRYTWKVMVKCCYNIKNMTSKQVAHMAYLTNKFSSLPGKDEKFNFQNTMCNILPELNCEEISLVCLSLMNMKFKISHSDLFDICLNLFLENMGDFSETSFTCFLDAMRKTATTSSIKNIILNQEKFLPHIDKLSVESLTSFIFCGVSCNLVSQTFLEKTFQKAVLNFSECNNQTLLRLAFISAAFSYINDEFIKAVIELLKSKEPPLYVDFVSFVRHLICLGVKDEDLIKTALSEECVEQVLKSKKKITKLDLDFVDNAAELEIPEYQGPRLNGNVKKSIWKLSKAFDYFDPGQMYPMRKHDGYMSMVENTLTETYGPEFSAWKKIASCYPNSVILRFDEDLNFTKIPSEFASNKTDYILKPLNDGHTWASVIIVSWFNRGLDGNVDLVTQARMRHLEKIGYKLLVLPTQLFWEARDKNLLDVLNDAVKIQLKSPK